MENSNLFQRRLLHHHEDHNDYDFVTGGHEDTNAKEKELKTPNKSTTNTLKTTDKNDNNLKLNNSTHVKFSSFGGDGSAVRSQMDSQLGKSVKFEIRNGSVLKSIIDSSYKNESQAK